MPLPGAQLPGSRVGPLNHCSRGRLTLIFTHFELTALQWLEPFLNKYSLSHLILNLKFFILFPKECSPNCIRSRSPKARACFCMPMYHHRKPLKASSLKTCRCREEKVDYEYKIKISAMPGPGLQVILLWDPLKSMI